jgi:DNA-binding MarR family transcriptional regulator
MSDSTESTRWRAAHECTAARLRRATRAVSNVYDALMVETGLRSTQFSLLTAISLAKEPSVTRLAELLELDRTTLTRNLRPLEREGLVKAVPSRDDARLRLVQLTAKGQRALERALPLWEQAQDRLVAALGQRDWRDLIASLDRVTSVAVESG